MCCCNAAIIVLSLFLISFCDPTSSECRQLAPCICYLPDGRYYNLTGLADEEPFVDEKFNWTVSFHPCTNVKMNLIENKTCNGTLCMLYNKENKDPLIWTIEETKMKLSSEGKFPNFEINHNDSNATINIVCRESSKTSFTLDPPISPNSKKFYFTLVSPYGCAIIDQKPEGLSTGSVLVIFFFITIGIYFIGGIIVLKTLRGATGWEMVPNHDFWSKLPSLVKDGVVFTFNCCRADSYERI